MNDEQLEAEVKEIFQDQPLAAEFIRLWTELVHLLDDVIDEPNDSERTLLVQYITKCLYSHPFYIANQVGLEMVTTLVDNTYADSVLWENSGEEWKIMHADSLRHCAYDVFYAVVYILKGRAFLRKFSLKFREYSHKKHLNDIIKWSKDSKTV